jgi:hypothetical protein
MHLSQDFIVTGLSHASMLPPWQITAPPRYVDNPVDRVKFGDAKLATSS